MPLLDDWIAEGSQQSEIFRTVVNPIETFTREVAFQRFPGIETHDSPNICYFDFNLCHSLPQVNERGRAFALPTLKRSFNGLHDQLIDWEHELKDNRIGTHDRIIGCVKAARFDIPAKYQEVASDPKAMYGEMASLEPLPVQCLGLLFMRASGVQEAVRAHNFGKEKWSVSMECGHRWKDGGFIYRGEYIPYLDAEIAMRDCVSPGSIKPFKGHKLVGCLGGLDGQVDFWGVGLTRSPADSKSEVFSFAAGRSRELSSRKIFVMPFQTFSDRELEVASKAVDKNATEEHAVSADEVLIELASLDIIGETQPDEPNGHTHPVLSNLMVVPANGHGHSLSNFHISRGSNPKVTGHTDSHYTYGSPEVSTGKTHLHLVSIPLKGKYKPDGTEDTSHLDPLTSEQASNDMNELLKKLLKQQQEIMAKMNGVTGDARTPLEKELASVGTQIVAALESGNQEQAAKDFLEAEIKAGRIVTKEVADAAVAEAVAKTKEELEKEHEAQLLAEQKKAARAAKCVEHKIDLATEFEGVTKADGKPMTLQDRLDSIALDDAGDKQFEVDLQLWAAAVKPEEPAPAPAAAAAGEVASKTKKKILKIAGEGATTQEEDASRETASKGDDEVPAHLQGRRAFKTKK
jgi:predicted protein tyrosine phosphatase